MEKFKGLGVALVTPFQQNGNVDYKGFEKLINHTIKGGVDYLVVQGTTGESATLSAQEKQAVLDFAVETIKERVPVVYGHGGNNTKALIEGFKTLNLKGVSAILSVSPYYNKPSQEGIYQHYKALNEASPLPIILYNVPGRTGSNMLPETTLRIAADCNNVIGIKEASGNLDQMGQIIKNRPEGFLVISGDDNLVLPQIAIGADGVISVIANALPKRFSTLVKSALAGDLKTAREFHNLLMDIIPLLFVEGNPAGVKAVLKALGICGDTVRLPLVNVSQKTYDSLYRAASEAGVSLE